MQRYSYQITETNSHKILSSASYKRIDQIDSSDISNELKKSVRKSIAKFNSMLVESQSYTTKTNPEIIRQSVA